MKKKLVITLCLDTEKLDPQSLPAVMEILNHPLRVSYEEDGIKGISVERVDILDIN